MRYFQSVLLDANGVAVSDGQYTVTFAIWDGENVDSLQLWEDQHIVSVEKGIYVTALGSGVPFSDPNMDGDPLMPLVLPSLII